MAKAKIIAVYDKPTRLQTSRFGILNGDGGKLDFTAKSLHSSFKKEVGDALEDYDRTHDDSKLINLDVEFEAGGPYGIVHGTLRKKK